MRRLLVAALAAGLGLTLAPAATAFPPNAVDRGCSAVVANDPGTPGTQTAVLFGGPVRQNGTLTCSITYIGETHQNTAAVSVTTTGTNGVTVITPTVRSYAAPLGVAPYLCSRFSDGAATYYWDGAFNVWTTNSGVRCERMNRADTSDVGDVATVKRDVVDPVLCPVLAALHPFFYPSDPVYAGADGDLYLVGVKVWDCPPYSTSTSTPYVEAYYEIFGVV